MTVYEPQPGPRPTIRFNACANELGGYCLERSFSVSLELKVPEGAHPLQRRYYVGDQHRLDRNDVSIVGFTEDGEHWLLAGSGTVTLYRDGPDRFSGQLSVELVDDESKPVRRLEATFGGEWYIRCAVSLDPPREGSWEYGHPEDPFCQQFESWTK